MTLLQKHLVFVPVLFATFAVLFGAIVMLLWNWLMPELFGLTTISFWQATGLLLLCKILFGGLGCGHHGHHHHACGCDHTHNKLMRHWESLSTEERERLMEMHESCHTTAATDGK